MKKLLFSLAAAATCGVAAAAPATATFDGATTFDPTKADDGAAISESNRGYWEIDVSTDPELTVTDKDSAALNYLQINTGSTPLWRTFAGVDGHVSTTNAALDAAAVDADGVVVSSDVKLTACTEWPTLSDFANEKLALFLFAPEEGDTSGKTAGLYAVGGAMVDGNLTATAYRLNAEPNAITNTDGWATIAIKSYADVYVNNTGAKYPAFVIAACKKGSATTNILSVAAGEAYAPGYTEANLSNAAKARIEDRELIPSAKTSDGKLVGLGFQGEGGIDNVSLATTDFAVDAVTMTATITGATVTPTSTGTSLNGTVLTFVPGSAVTFTVAKNAGLDILTVTYKGGALEADENGVYTIDEPEANAQLVVTASAAAFQIGDGENAKKYATLADALKDLKSGDTLKLVKASVDAGADGVEFDADMGNITIDLNGYTLSATGADEVIYNDGANITIIDSSDNGSGLQGSGKVAGAIGNAAGTLVINAGIFEGEIKTNQEGVDDEFVGKTTINGGKFAVKCDAAALPTNKKWSALSAGYYSLVDAGPVTSTTVDLSGVGTGEEVEVAPTIAESVTEVTVEKLPQGFAGKVVIPSTVTSISGVPAANIAVKVGTVDITGAFTKTTADGKVTLDLNPEGEVKVGAEIINVKPDLADGAEETPFVAGDTTAATVKTIPGLKYSLVWDSDLGFAEDSKTKGGTSPATATSSRMTLTDDTPAAQKPTKRFYKVMVTK